MLGDMSPMLTLTLDRLSQAVAADAAIRRRQTLVPMGGDGDKVFPPTYPGEGRNAPARHAFEKRRVDGHDQPVDCVLIDSVQSQANRLEAALVEALRGGRISLPHLAVDFAGLATKVSVEGGVSFTKGQEFDLSDLGTITSLEAPHRLFDAIIRDSELDGKRFTETDLYKQRLTKAKPQSALAIFETSPTALLFGVWNSTGEGGGLGAKFQRCIISEIYGVGAVLGEKVSSRIDPLGIRATARVVGGPGEWKVARGEKGEKPVRPSEINHSNIAPSMLPGGVTIDHAVHSLVITFAGLRRLRFPGEDERAAQTVLAALALVAVTEQDAQGYDLRSRCALIPRGDAPEDGGAAPFELVHANGTTDPFRLDRDQARTLFDGAVAAAKKKGLPWNTDPIVLKPQQRLVELVALSRALALQGHAEDEKEG